MNINPNIIISQDKDSSNDSAIISDKLQQLTEKREQERKKNLEKAKEATKIINEARLLKELEKEKLQEERKQKREAIFEVIALTISFLEHVIF